MARKRPAFDDKTLRLDLDKAEATRALAATSLSLMVYHRDGVRVVPLRNGSAVTIGRDEPADCVIDDRSLSREHARFRIEAGHLIVDDLGSTNGTFVNGSAVTTAHLGHHDVVTLGGVLVSADTRAAEPQLHGLSSHDSFRTALEREITSAGHFREALSLVMVAHADRAHVAQWWPLLEPSLRPVDLPSLYSNDVVEVLLPRTAKAEACNWCARAEEAELRFGVAWFPDCATSAERLIESARRALRAAGAREPLVVAESRAAGVLPTPGAASGRPIALSVAMREVLELVERVAQSSIGVLLVGETGSGKEVIAREIHERGPRKSGPLVAVNCGAIPEQLVESTLFGHVKGAFTGAERDSPGAFGAADGGTVLLDEIGELPPPAQSALLRVLETKRMVPVGTAAEVDVDVRVITATHRDLEVMCDGGQFRRDLLYRLNAVTIAIPPLRERREEIASLTRHFFEAALRDNRRDLEGLSSEASLLLQKYDWPGNLRELKNAVERAVVIARGTRIEAEDLPERLRRPRAIAVGRSYRDIDDGPEDLKTRTRRFEARIIEAALDACGGSQTEAAKRLDVPLRTLVHKIKTLGVKR